MEPVPATFLEHVKGGATCGTEGGQATNFEDGTRRQEAGENCSKRSFIF
jgi:hypothetical protein